MAKALELTYYHPLSKTQALIVFRLKVVDLDGKKKAPSIWHFV